ncbi:MAG: sialate O-acetylesterase, partial [Verrucomicrobiales bacterium]
MNTLFKFSLPALVLFALPPVSGLAQDKKIATPPPTAPPLIATEINQLPEGSERLDLYLLIGQSNMKGRGTMPETPLNSPSIAMMHLKNDAWYLARHPLHLTGDPQTLAGHDNAGVGPGLAFAEAMLASDPAARIGLIPCAKGGSAISLWGKEGPLYLEAIRRAKLALSRGPSGKTRLRGVLWLQG